jgi:hypothetical protein
MAIDPLYARCTKRAAELLGGYDELGSHLSISPVILRRWAQGHGTPPSDVFLKIIDIVLSDAAADGTRKKKRL